MTLDMLGKHEANTKEIIADMRKEHASQREEFRKQKD